MTEPGSEMSDLIVLRDRLCGALPQLTFALASWSTPRHGTVTQLC